MTDTGIQPPLRERPRVLIIDDQSDLTRFCQRVMGDQYRFEQVTSGKAAEAVLAQGSVAATLVDRDFSRGDRQGLIGPVEDICNEGIHIVRWVRRHYPHVPTLMVTGYREQRPALEMAELGGDFLAWQDVIDDPDILRARLQRALERHGDRGEDIICRFRELGVVVESPELKSTLLALHEASLDGAPILLTGETGTGKDTLAFAVHALTGESNRPFVCVNAAALSPALVESELFGHARGAFTGAERAYIGRLRHADGGTLFLNEIAELPLPAQAKLLTALERNEVVPVGDVQSYPARFQLVTGSSEDLLAAVAAGTFRRDFYHRLAWHTILIPPLRDRRGDIPALVRSFVRGCGQGTEWGIAGISREAVQYLADLPWAGNVRELKAVVQAAGAVASYFITLGDVREVLRRNEGAIHSGHDGTAEEGTSLGSAAIQPDDAGRTHPEELTYDAVPYRVMMERYFAYLYHKCDGNLPELARAAGIAKATAYEWKGKYGKDL